MMGGMTGSGAPGEPDKLGRRVVAAAEAALSRQGYVSAVDVLTGLGWLSTADVDRWRQGRLDCLEQGVSASLPKVSTAMAAFRRWAAAVSRRRQPTGGGGRLRPARGRAWRAPTRS